MTLRDLHPLYAYSDIERRSLQLERDRQQSERRELQDRGRTAKSEKPLPKEAR